MALPQKDTKDSHRKNIKKYWWILKSLKKRKKKEREPQNVSSVPCPCKINVNTVNKSK